VRLSLLTFNTWHGLNHRNPYTMLPVESIFQRQERSELLGRNLKAFTESQTQADLCVVSLQELNPVRSRFESLRKSLGLNGDYSRVNHGVKLGLLSYPLFLDEGLVLLWSKNFQKEETEHLLLSGEAWGLRKGLLPFCLNLAECRGALLVSGHCGDKRLLLVNLHLHHSKGDTGGDARRLEEVTKLLGVLESKKHHHDSILLMGDFNCDAADPMIGHFAKAGFRPPGGGDAPLATWDPINNPYAHLETTMNTDPEVARWTRSVRQLDHILLWHSASTELLNPQTRLLFNEHGEVCSDHFGLEVVGDLKSR
jgi:endonuclease/exonuclease/phosphatase family metal-dependent hydrolase